MNHRLRAISGKVGLVISAWFSRLLARKTVCKYCKHEIGPDSPAKHHGVSNRLEARIEYLEMILLRAQPHVTSDALNEEIDAILDDYVPLTDDVEEGIAWLHADDDD